MDIALNITSGPQPMRSKPEKKMQTHQTPKYKSKNNHSNAFLFNFGGGEQKVKAIVARKRPSVVKKIIDKTTDTAKKVKVSKPIASISVNKNMPEPTQNETTKSVSSSPLISMGDNLTLNIISKPLPDDSQVKKSTQVNRKLNRFERQRLKREERFKPPQKRVFGEEELKEGLRRFTENPNKRPRVADIFDAEERRKRQESKNKAFEELNAKSDESTKHNKSDEKETLKKAEVDYGEVNPNARKVNAFRVKRPEESTVKAIDLFRDNPEARELGQRFVKPIAERIFDGTKVETLGLHPHAVKNLVDLLSIAELTTVQKKTIPKALEGKDVLVRAQTGSGKTLAYALPIVEKLQAIRPKTTRESGVLAVIIVPTRELVMQTYELFLKLVKPFTWIVPGMLMGGEKRKAEKARLRKGINILIGTPGRLVDHLLHTTSFNLDKTQFLVLDEADRMLELSYERDVQQIVEAISNHRKESNVSDDNTIQRFLLSATLTPAVQKLAGLIMQDPVYIDNSEEDPSQAIRNSNGYAKDAIQSLPCDLLDDEQNGILTIPENLELNFVVVPPKLRLVAFSGLLAKEFAGKTKFKAMVFMGTMEMVNYHHDLLNEILTQKILDEEDEEIAKEQEEDDNDDEPLLKGLRFFKLHGDMSHTEREGVFKSFRECKSGVLLATDVVGRGIDVSEIDLVIQYSPPQFVADFVHRAGRTARAGRKGRAIIFLAPNEAQFVRHLEENRIRLSQVDMEPYLKVLKRPNDKAHTVQEAASHLQYKFQELVADDREMHTKACKAFVSWVKFYSTFPRDLKPIFNAKKAHMGHFAKSFALKDAPKSFVSKHTAPKPALPTNRLTYTERDPEVLKTEKRTKHNKRFTTTVTNEIRNTKRSDGDDHSFDRNRLVRMLPNSLALTTSEFDSGLPSLKKKKTKT